jgi:hypothetical protein
VAYKNSIDSFLPRILTIKIPMLKLQTRLHPTDLLPESAAAFEVAVTLAKLSGGTSWVEGQST